jgi:hypothetical protein
MKHIGFPLLAGLALGLCACGGDRAPEEAAMARAASSKAESAPSASVAQENVPAPQVEAATQPAPKHLPKLEPMTPARESQSGKPGAPLEIKYALASSPEVGQPLVIDFAIVPRAASPAVNVMVATSGSLSLRQSSAPPVERDVKAGSEYWYQAVVVPQETGVFSVNIIATTGEGDRALARTLAIPVVVGVASFDDAKAQKPNLPVDATGQPIEVMPGQESR